MSDIKGPDGAQNPEQVLERLVSQYQSMLLRMCYLYLRDRALAEDAVKAFLGEGVYLADPEGNRVLNYGCWYDWSDETQAAHFRLEFDPVADPLPQNVSLAPFVAHDPRWDERSVSYNPAVAEPENVVGAYQLDLSRAICIELESSFSYRPVPHGAG